MKKFCFIFLSLAFVICLSGVIISREAGAYETFESAKVYDLSEIGTGLQTISSSAKEVGTFPDKENVGVSFQVKMSETEQTWENGLLFVPFSKDLWEEERLSVQVTEGMIYLTNPNTHQEKLQTYRDASITKGAVFNLEIGRIGILNDGERIGWQIYVKYNGKQILSMRENSLPSDTKFWVYYGINAPSILYGKEYFALNINSQTAEFSDTILKKGEESAYCYARPEWFYYEPKEATYGGVDILGQLEQTEQGVWRIPLEDPEPGKELHVEFVTEGYVLRTDDATVSDLYDAGGNAEIRFTKLQTTYGIGVLSKNNNVAFSTIIDFPKEEFYALRIVIGASDTWDMWQCGGYMVKIEDNKMCLCSSKEDVIFAIREESGYGCGDRMKLEFGVRKFYVNNEYRANYLYVLADGELLLEYYDSSIPQLGRAVIGMYLEKYHEDLRFSSGKTLYRIKLSGSEGVTGRTEIVEKDEEVTFAIPVDDGFLPIVLTVDGVDKLSALKKSYGGYFLELGKIEKDVEIILKLDKGEKTEESDD